MRLYVAGSWRNETYAGVVGTLQAAGFDCCKYAMQDADACVLVLPAGRSAHLAAGWFAGAGKPVFVLTRDGEKPALMALVLDLVFTDMLGLLEALEEERARTQRAREHFEDEAIRALK